MSSFSVSPSGSPFRIINAGTEKSFYHSFLHFYFLPTCHLTLCTRKISCLYLLVHTFDLRVSFPVYFSNILFEVKGLFFSFKRTRMFSFSKNPFLSNGEMPDPPFIYLLCDFSVCFLWILDSATTFTVSKMFADPSFYGLYLFAPLFIITNTNLLKVTLNYQLQLRS